MPPAKAADTWRRQGPPDGWAAGPAGRVSAEAELLVGLVLVLAANIRADAEGRYDSVEPGWQAGVEWTLLWIENTASQLTKDRH